MMNEDFTCICGKEFDTLELLQDHWRTDNSETTGRPHYRDHHSKDLSEASIPFRKDGSQ